ncbi:MAG TPA: hypothetical protein V6C81_00170 [Planktothrix sp.]|jgi:hypothetical protein
MDIILYTVIAFVLIAIFARILCVAGRTDLSYFLPGYDEPSNKKPGTTYWSDYPGVEAKQPVESRKEK